MKLKQQLRRLFVGVLHRLPPDSVLRTLFQLDNWLYYLQGQMAIAYGGGLHTKHRHMNYHNFFVSRIQPGEQVIDLGCGVGAVAYAVAEEAGAEVLGIDLNAKSIATAQTRHAHPRVTYLVGDVLALVPTRPCDTIILPNVLEHLPHRPQFLAQLQQQLQPQRFLIRVPLFERDWRVPLKKELGIDYRLDPTHEIEYTLESFAAEMAEAKLHISYQEVRWGEIWVECRAISQP